MEALDWELDLDGFSSNEIGEALFNDGWENVQKWLLSQDQHSIEREAETAEEPRKEAEKTVEKLHSKKINRREIVKKSETKRRNRMNEHMEVLKQIIPHGKMNDSKKIRKEDIIVDTIEYVKKLEKEIEILRESRERVKKKQKMPMDKPFSSTQDELIASFWNIMKKTQTPAHKGKSLYSIACMLEELAPRIQQVILIQGNFLKKIERYYGICSPDPHRQQIYNDRGLAIYTSIQQKRHPSGPILMHNMDMGGAFLAQKSSCMIAEGYLDEGMHQMRVCQEWVKRLNHESSQSSLQMGIWWTRYLIGESTSISEAFEIKVKCEANALTGFVAEMGYGFAIIEHSDSKEAKLEGLAIVEKGIGTGFLIFGVAGLICVAGIILNSYLKSGMIDKGIEKADLILSYVKETEIEGIYGLGELQRLKAELLIQKMKESKDFQENTIKIIGDLLDSAVHRAIEKNMKAIQLKAILSSLRFWRHIGNKEKLNTSIQQLKDLNAFYLKEAKRNVIGDIAEARKMLEELSISEDPSK